MLQNISFDPMSNNSFSKHALSLFWRNEWKWVALAWLGGILICSIMLALIFSSDYNSGVRVGIDSINKLIIVIGTIFLLLAPGIYATWETWRRYRKSISKNH